MIRINLLAEKREVREAAKAPSAGPSASAASLYGIAAALVVVAAIAWCGWNWYRLDNRVKGLNDEISAADQQIAELKKALKTMDDYQVKKKELEHRVEIISDLKRRQNVPVQLLDMLSRQVPEFLWLEGLEEKGGGISVRGKATTYNAVSNFYNNLKDSPFFADVTLGTTQKVPEGVSFLLSCRFLAQQDQPTQPPAEVTGAESGPAAAAPPAEPRG